MMHIKVCSSLNFKGIVGYYKRNKPSAGLMRIFLSYLFLINACYLQQCKPIL